MRAKRERVRIMKIIIKGKIARKKMSTLIIMTLLKMMIHSAMISMINMILTIILSFQLQKGIGRPTTLKKTLF